MVNFLDKSNTSFYVHFSGRLCKMLRNSRLVQPPNLCRQNSFKEVDGKNITERKDGPRDLNPQVPPTQACGGIP